MTDDAPPTSALGEVDRLGDETLDDGLLTTTQMIASAARFMGARQLEPTTAFVLIVVIIAALLVLGKPAKAQDLQDPAQAPAVRAALAEAEAFPQDYGAARRLAEAATAWGAWELALQGWERAEAISGSSYETAIGKVVPLLQTGRVVEARAAAKEATVLAPGSGRAWRLLAWARRQTTRWQTGTYARLGARDAYRRALLVDPEDRSAACGLAWTILGWGDRLGAERGFQALLAEQADDACAQEGLDAAAPTWRAGGGYWLSGYAYSNSTRTGGMGNLFQGWVTLGDLVSLELTGRILVIDTVDNAIKVTGTQGELWARLGVDHAGHGGEVLVGLIDRSSRDTTEVVIAGRAWAQLGVRLRLEGAVSNFTDGTAALVGAGIHVPVFSLLSVDAGVQLTRWFPEASTATDVGAMVEGSLVLHPVAGLDITLTGRGGVGWAPIRFDQPSIWNTTERQLGGGALTVAGRLTPFLTLHGGYEAVALGATATETTATTSWTHVFTFGVTVDSSGGLKR